MPDVRAAVAWYCEVFGLVEHVRIGDSHRAQLGVPGERAELIVAEAREDSAPAEVMIKVDDVDAVLARAAGAGAEMAGEARTYQYGERQAEVVDPFGHRWTLTQTVRDTAPAAWGGSTVVPRAPAD